MFRHEIDAGPFGRLSKQGRHATNWSGRVLLPAFAEAFDLTLHGTAEGPLPEQIAAMEALVRDAASIRLAASKPMLDLYREAPLDRLPAADDPQAVWDVLSPAFVEICDRSYYGDDRICIVIVFESREEPGFMPAIETADGRFVGVLSGT